MNYFNICINFLDMHNDFHSKNTNLHDVRIFSNLGAQFIIISGLVDSIINYINCVLFLMISQTFTVSHLVLSKIHRLNIAHNSLMYKHSLCHVYVTVVSIIIHSDLLLVLTLAVV